MAGLCFINRMMSRGESAGGNSIKSSFDLDGESTIDLDGESTIDWDGESTVDLDGESTIDLELTTIRMTDVVEPSTENMLPDEVMEEILKRLPFVARFRFRCVCSKWKSLLSCDSSSLPFTEPIPSCTVLSYPWDTNALFFCNAESKWFNVPRIALTSSERQWVLEDVDKGFVCLMRNDGESGQYHDDYSIAISNPLVNSFQVLPKIDSEEYRYNTISKLWVDQENSTFKVIVLVNIPAMTEIFDSCTSQWDSFESHDEIINFELGRVEFFFWKNVPYIHCFYETDTFGTFDSIWPPWCSYDGPRIFSLDVESREWTRIDAEFPGQDSFPMQYTIIIHEDEVMLVQICLPAGSEFLSVWKLLDDPNEDSNFSLSRWEKIIVVPDKPTLKLGIHPCRHIHYCDEYVFFVLDGDEVPRHLQAPASAKYTFATKTWSLTTIPKRVQWIGSTDVYSQAYRSFQWKPTLDKEVKLQDQEFLN